MLRQNAALPLKLKIFPPSRNRMKSFLPIFERITGVGEMI